MRQKLDRGGAKSSEYEKIEERRGHVSKGRTKRGQAEETLVEQEQDVKKRAGERRLPSVRFAQLDMATEKMLGTVAKARPIANGGRELGT